MMGLFDNLGRIFKGVTGDTGRGTASQGGISGTDAEGYGWSSSESASAKSIRKNAWNPAKEHPGYRRSLLNQCASQYKRKPNSLSNGDVLANFENMLYTEFPEYEIRSDISATEIGGAPGCVRYTFGMYKDGFPMVFIMLTPPGNLYLKKAFEESKMACINHGIKFVNFFTHFENDRTYAMHRIREYL